MQENRKKGTKLTKQLIMDAALRLFYKDGYSSSSVEAIVKKANVSKGAFYHHFSSKEALLDAIIFEFVDKSIEVFKRIAEDKKYDALTKLNKIMSWSSNPSHFKEVSIKKGLMLAGVIMQGDNIKLFDKFQSNLVARFSPYLLQIFKQGAKEKKFNIFYPEETCEFYIELMTSFERKFFSHLKDCQKNPAQIKIIEQNIRFFEDVINKILGAAAGSVKLAAYKKIIRYLPKLYKELS